MWPLNLQTSIKTNPVSVGVGQAVEESKETVTNVVADLQQIPLEELEDSYGTYPERYKPTS